MRFDGVEIKVSLGGRPLVSFVEDATDGMTLPLFHRGVVLRARQVDGDDDSTVKLRRCEAAPATTSRNTG